MCVVIQYVTRKERFGNAPKYITRNGKEIICEPESAILYIIFPPSITSWDFENKCDILLETLKIVFRIKFSVCHK